MTREKAISKVLELKGFTKEQLESEARRKKKELDREKRQLDFLENLYRKTEREFSDRQTAGSLAVCELELFSTYLFHIGGQVDRQRAAVLKRRMEVEEKEKALIEAYKEERLFEILHEKIVRAEIKQEILDEQKEADYNYLTRRE